MINLVRVLKQNGLVLYRFIFLCEALLIDYKKIKTINLQNISFILFTFITCSDGIGFILTTDEAVIVGFLFKIIVGT
jgi:hypothetical protein